MYRPGDRVVYTASKHSRHPALGPKQVTPERHGEGYFYDVRKYWLVRAVGSDGTLTVVTRRGKERQVSSADDRGCGRRGGGRVSFWRHGFRLRP